ncbi:hypothetical protein ACP70R_011694 [Stipagrostis hirtigluma subsp. patula]
MELCAGGELLDRIIARGQYTDHRADRAELPLHGGDAPGQQARELAAAQQGHRLGPLRLLQGRRGAQGGGTARRPTSGASASCSTSSSPAFWAENENAIFTAILRPRQPHISSGAKDLVKNINPKDRRLTAFQVLNHPWIKEDGDAPDTPLDNVVLNRLKQFRAMNQFNKAALTIIAGCLSEVEITGLKEMFNNIDKDNSGTITLDELKNGLAKHATKLTDSEIQQLMEAVNGLIHYDELVSATVHMNKLNREEHLYTAFQYVDKDNSGLITKEELEQALKEQGLYDAEKIKEVISDADSDNDGRIDYSEFVAMMRKGTAGAEPVTNKKRRDVVL